MKLYWRIKKPDGSWTYSAVVFVDHEKDTIQELIDEIRILPPGED